MQRSLRILIAFLCALFLTSVALACPTCRTGIAPRYMSGGVGEAELTALRNQERDFNTKMVFSGADRAYLADIHVVVRDGRGNVVFAEKNLGPILLMQLPEGSYEISAAAPGTGRSAARTVKAGAAPGSELVFVLQ